MANPFAQAADPADEPEETPVDSAPATTSKEDPAAVAADYHPYKITLKSGDGYEAEWFTLSYRTLEDVQEDFSGDRAELLLKVMGDVSTAAKVFRQGGAGVKRGSGGGGSNSGGGRPAGATEIPSWAGQPTRCDHGQKVWKKRMKKDESGYWHGWCCPEGDRSCKTDFKNPPK